jgi:predicted Ser/Thr protein kinase
MSRLLVVGDAAMRVLEGGPHEICAVAGFDDALPRLLNEPWDLVVSSLPPSRALDLVRIARALKEPVPVVVIGDAAGTDALQAGASDCLPTADPGLLLAAVSRVVRTRPAALVDGPPKKLPAVPPTTGRTSMICLNCRRLFTPDEAAAAGAECTDCHLLLFPGEQSVIYDVELAPRFLNARYLPYRLLSRGTFADVWLAWQPDPGRRVVIKLLVNPSERSRFERESRVQATLKHPNIPAVFEAGEDPAGLFVAIEYIDGTTLLDFSDQLLGAIDERERIAHVLSLVVEVADTLDYMHARGYVHRDIKPSNIMITAAERAYLIDYGLARTIDRGEALTVEGTLLGTAPFMAPEQFRGVPEEIDARTDIWALGATLYLLFTARYPFIGSTFEELSERAQLTVPDPPRSFNEAIPVEVDRLIMISMSKLPERRYQKASAMAAAMRAALKRFG